MRNFLFAGIMLLASCNWAKDKTKAAVHKTGEVAAVAGSEFADGVSKGVEKSFGSQVSVSPALQAAGLKTGKIVINSSDSATDNILSAYLIFDKELKTRVTARVFDAAGQEYGRISVPVSGAAGSARYIDFPFDKRTNIDGRGKVTFE
jgi:hypothetical protein